MLPLPLLRLSQCCVSLHVGQKVQTIPGIVDTRTIITFKAF